MKLSFYISKKLISAPQKAFSALIMRISIIATAVSVAAMIVASSFVNGFQQVVAEKIYSFWGHLRIEHYEPLRSTNAEAALIEKNDSLEILLKKYSNIKSITPFVTHSAILNTNGTIEGVMIKGISSNYPNENLSRYLKKGSIPNWKDSTQHQQILLSTSIANQLKTKVGASILVYFISKDGASPRVRKMIVAGLFSTGIDIYDQAYAIGNLEYLNKINQIPSNSINGYEIQLKETSLMDQTANQIFTFLPVGWNAITIKDLSPEIFDWLALQDTNKYIFLGLMLVVATINLITCLIILLLERTNMIAVLKSLGARDKLIQSIFVYYGSWIASIGILAGGILGILLCLVQQKWPFIKLNEEIYYVSTVPVQINTIQVIAIIVGTFLISMLMLLLPSAIGRKINVSKTLHFK